MVIDFRRKKNTKDNLIVGGNVVEDVQCFKLLGTIITNDIHWSENSEKILKKARQRLFFLRTLKQYGMKYGILRNFYNSIIESILTYSITVWCGGATKREKDKLNSVIRSAGKIIGCNGG